MLKIAYCQRKNFLVQRDKQAHKYLAEFILTFFLMFVTINVATTVNPDGIMAGVAIGGTVAMAALFAGPATGASMNPVRSLAPALVSGHLTSLWVYLLAPCLGAVLAAFYWRWMRRT
jgi:aquaporin Z